MADDVQKIAQRIELSGEKEYNAALKEARQNLKVLQSQLKAETAELGKNATAQEKAEVKTRNLQKQIKEQEKVVRAYEKALAASTEKYGENSEAVAKWEIKLNDARAALANMRNGLNDVGEGMKQVQASSAAATVAAHSVAESLEKVASVGSTISGAIEGAFSGTVSYVKDIVSQVWETVVDLAARSNSMVDLAGYWGTDVTTVQKYKGAVEEASGSLEDLATLVTRINAADPTKLASLTNVSKANYKDQWKYAMAVMDAMSTLSTEDRNAAGFEIFGRGQATKAFDLMNDWQTVLDNLDKYDPTKGGYGLTEEQMSQMSELYDKVNGLRASWQALQDMATVHLFGDLAMNVTGNLQNIVDAFKDYFNAEDDSEKAAAMEKVKQNIVEMFKNVRDAIQDGIELLSGIAEDLKSSDDALSQALGKALDGLVNALEWLADEGNWETIKSGIEWLIGIWAAGKVTSAIGNLVAFGSHLTTVFGWAGKTGAAGAAGAAASSAAGAAGGGIFSSLLGAVIKAFPWAAGLYATLKPSDTGNDDLVDKDGNLTELGKWYEEQMREQEEQKANRPADSRTDYQKWHDSMVKKYHDDLGAMTALEGGTRYQALQDYWDKLRTGEGHDISNQMEVANVFGRGVMTEANWDALQELLDRMHEEDKSQEDLPDEFFGLMDQFVQELSEANDNNGLPEDVPADWWNNNGQNGEGLTSADLAGFRGLPKQMAAAVSSGVSGIKVYMSGQEVGNLVAPYVSEALAAQMD